MGAHCPVPRILIASDSTLLAMPQLRLAAQEALSFGYGIPIEGLCDRPRSEVGWFATPNQKSRKTVIDGMCAISGPG